MQTAATLVKRALGFGELVAFCALSFTGCFNHLYEHLALVPIDRGDSAD